MCLLFRWLCRPHPHPHPSVYRARRRLFIHPLSSSLLTTRVHRCRRRHHHRHAIRRSLPWFVVVVVVVVRRRRCCCRCCRWILDSRFSRVNESTYFFLSRALTHSLTHSLPLRERHAGEQNE